MRMLRLNFGIHLMTMALAIGYAIERATTALIGGALTFWDWTTARLTHIMDVMAPPYAVMAGMGHPLVADGGDVYLNHGVHRRAQPDSHLGDANLHMDESADLSPRAVAHPRK